MMYLADFSVIKPDVGLIFWSTIFFLLFWLLIGKMAFKPIKDALKNRETDIKTALDSAEEAKREVAAMKSQNDELLKKAQEERMLVLREAKETAERVVRDAKDKAKEEANNIIINASREIESQKQAALREIKSQVGTMAVTIAENILKKELSSDASSADYVTRMVDGMNFN
jgi:F-type H+-transporting ATPase subunit b